MVIGWSQLMPYEQNPCELRVRCMKAIRDFAGSDSAKWAATLATHSSSGLLSSLLFLKDPVAQQGEAVLGANLLKASHSIALRMCDRPSSTTAINDPFESIKCPWLQRYPSIPRYLHIFMATSSIGDCLHLANINRKEHIIVSFQNLCTNSWNNIDQNCLVWYNMYTYSRPHHTDPTVQNHDTWGLEHAIHSVSFLFECYDLNDFKVVTVIWR